MAVAIVMVVSAAVYIAIAARVGLSIADMVVDGAIAMVAVRLLMTKMWIMMTAMAMMLVMLIMVTTASVIPY